MNKSEYLAALRLRRRWASESKNKAKNTDDQIRAEATYQAYTQAIKLFLEMDK